MGESGDGFAGVGESAGGDAMGVVIGDGDGDTGVWILATISMKGLSLRGWLFGREGLGGGRGEGGLMDCWC